MATDIRSIHNPASDQFDPSHYEVLGVVDLYPDADDETTGWDVAALNHEMREYGNPVASPDMREGYCTHCGQKIRYAAFLIHLPTRTHITVGQECLGNRFDGMTRAQFQALRKSASLNRERRAHRDIRAERAEVLARRDPRLIVLGDLSEASKMDRFLGDLSEKLPKYELTDRQVDAAIRTLDRIAQREAEKAERRPAPVGKVTVVGEIVSVKAKESEFGLTYKMTVKADDGYLVWITVPAVLQDAAYALKPDHTRDGGIWEAEEATMKRLVGKRVQFNATLDQSATDPTFAFGKRPTKASLLD